MIPFFAVGARFQVKTSLDEGAERSMLTSDDRLLAAVAWAEEQGLGLNVFLDVVRKVALGCDPIISDPVGSPSAHTLCCLQF